MTAGGVYGCWTPLHFAASRGRLEVVRYLLACGADSTARSEGGLLPLEVAWSEEVRLVIREDDDRRTNHRFKRMREEGGEEGPAAKKQAEEEEDESSEDDG